MTPTRDHRIQRQVIELSFAGSGHGVESQAVLARAVRDHVMPALQQAFDAACGPGECLRLDRLALDLGTIRHSDWVPQFRARLVEQVKRELDEHVAPQRGIAQAAQAPSEPARPLQQFVFFLAHGRLPWWGERPAAGFGAEFDSGRARLDWKLLRAAVHGDPRACERLADVLSDAQLDAGVQQWGGVPHAAQALAAWTPGHWGAAVRLAWRRSFWLTLLQAVLEDSQTAVRPQLLVRALRSVRRGLAPQGAGGSAPSHSGASSGQGGAGAPPMAMPTPWNDWLAAAPESAAPASLLPRVQADTAPSGAQTALPAAAQTAAQTAAGIPAPPTANTAQRRTAREDAEPLYLPGAGAVLLHPFLDTLFRDRGLLDGRSFCSDAARVRAVRLLGLMVFGEVDVPEHDLVIAKHLCACPLAEVLAPVVFDAADVAACNDLLAAVLGHWQALRSSSPAWLRAQFFLRDGKLEQVDGGSRLTVERRAQDVLLPRLPWGFGAIRLPWMQDTLFVRWLD